MQCSTKRMNESGGPGYTGKASTMYDVARVNSISSNFVCIWDLEGNGEGCL